MERRPWAGGRLHVKVVGAVVVVVCMLFILQLGMRGETGVEKEGEWRRNSEDGADLLDDGEGEGEPLVRWVVPGVFAFADCGGARDEEPVQYEAVPRSSRPHITSPGKKKVDIAMITSLTLHYSPNKFGRTPAKRPDPRAAPVGPLSL